MPVLSVYHRGVKPIPRRFLLHPARAAAVGFGAGYAPKLPGTAGTVIGVVLYLPLQYLPWPWYLGLVILLFVAGIGLCGAAAADLGVHDHPGIVWDEIVGYLITMIAAPRGWAWMAMGFVLFRLFDIWKPWPVNVVDERMRDGLGIMVDDAVAGLYGWIILQIIHILYSVSVIS